MSYQKEIYCTNYETFMENWAAEIWKWSNSNATFYKDGVFDVNTWFEDYNSFRPLFVLKEVNESICENDNLVNFVGIGDEGSDPWKGEGMWKRIGALAVAMLHMVENGDKNPPDYNYVITKMDEIKQSGESERQSACRKIALINLKKLAGGSNVGSEKSQTTLDFSCHARRFADNLKQQIDYISPTVIICCGKNVAELLDVENGKIGDIPVINGPHPNRSSTEKFYYKTLKELVDRKLLPNIK